MSGTGWQDGDLHDLDRLRLERDRVEAGIRAQVAHLRQRGCPWSAIADALAVTKQAAHKRYASTRVSLEDQPLPESSVR